MSLAALCCAIGLSGCSTDQLVAQRTSAPREQADAEICPHLALISTLASVDPYGPEMTAALDAAIDLAPSQVADALEFQREVIWMSPEDALDFDHAGARESVTTIDRFAAQTCGVAVFDLRITPDNLTLPDLSEIEQTDLGPDYLPDRPQLEIEAGGQRISWTMPRTNLIDGPRALRNIPAPATGTFWAYGGLEVELRYDAMLLTDLSELGANDDEIVRNALSMVNGGAVMELGTSERAWSTLQLEYMERRDDRVYLGKAYSWAGNVFTVSVGIPWNREDLVGAAEIEFERLDATVAFRPA